ncbi:uncharacterized protein F5891DRAFT_976237 [Suillus fuscotomentosus]|uniref:Uncharacterized protein n=1 Tax=Suillus fuscotomentosus TaxID=1912939 RepID=A0AAD4HPG9_9AGAM|nr:uncharacterized protein F5891DRAFT_976237 [Suillus fuscotomentosus]KAG1905280.1 hypothetical protein F5891DRAFT_976237 [Suillus fuscotomentosus]
MYSVTDATLESNDKTLYIDLGALDKDGIHPQAAGRTLFLSVLPASKDKCFVTESAKLKGFGRHIALWHSFAYPFEEMWQLDIWDWQHSATSNCFLPMDHIDSSPQLQAQQAMYISDLKNQLLCITTGGCRTFIISTRIFFNLEGIAAAAPVPWEHWGPLNTRIFEFSCELKVHVSGNRVLQALVSTSASGDVEYTLHVLDFSPLAVTNRRGLGRVVKEPSTIPEFNKWTGRPAKSLITSLPYVEVILDRRFGSAESELADVWVDKDRIYLLNTKFDHEVDRVIYVVAPPYDILKYTGISLPFGITVKQTTVTSLQKKNT